LIFPEADPGSSNHSSAEAKLGSGGSVAVVIGEFRDSGFSAAPSPH
jgi:hypothetical protein